MKEITLQGKTYLMSIADCDLKEIRIMKKNGSNVPEIFYYDSTNGALFPVADNTMDGDARHAEILAAVQAQTCCIR